MKDQTAAGKLPFISKFAYGMGDVGCNFSWMFVGNFLMIFYTDAFGISMGAVSLLMLLSRFWDAINDPIIGTLADKTNTRWGRYRPWLLVAAPLTAFILVLTFWAHPDWSETAKIVYMAVTYCILVLGYTCVNIPYGTLCGAMTQNIDERAQINTFRSVSAMTAIGIINIITIPLIHYFGGDDIKTGFLIVAILYGCIFAACHLFCFANTKEVVKVTKKQEQIPWGRQFKAAKANTPYLLALVGQLLFGVINYGRNADLVYYFKYVEGNSLLFSTYSLAIIIPSIIGAGSFIWAFKWLKNKGWAAAFFSICCGISTFMLYFFSPNSSPVPFYIFAILTQFFFSGFNTAIYAINPDCVEYGEWKTGIRNDGFQYSFVSLGNKIGMAIGTSLLALAMAEAGFVANAAQNAEVVSIIHNCFSTIPGILWILTGIVLFFYRLNRDRYNKIFAELQQRKGSVEEYDIELKENRAN